MQPVTNKKIKSRQQQFKLTGGTFEHVKHLLRDDESTYWVMSDKNNLLQFLQCGVQETQSESN